MAAKPRSVSSSIRRRSRPRSGARRCRRCRWDSSSPRCRSTRAIITDVICCRAPKMLANSWLRSGVASSAAAEGVGARRSATSSAMVWSVSWPTPDTTGMPEANMARATSSELKHHRSSSEPPPRATMITSASPSTFNRAIAPAICPAATSPCTAVGDNRSSASGYRRRTTFWMSCHTAPVGEVTTPMTRGNSGSGRLREGSNNPSASSCWRSRASSRARAPAPTGSTAATCILASPEGG